MKTGETEEYKGYEIEIHYDEYAENPFEDWDGEPPILVYNGDSSLTSYSKKYGDLEIVPTLTREEILANDADILAMVNCDSFLEICRDANCHSSEVVECINDRIDTEVNYLSDRKKIEVLAELYSMKGLVTVTKSVTGSSQGDWAEVLCVLTPEFLEVTGAPNEESVAEYACKLYGHWAFGEVYRFEVKGIDNESCNSVFYGYDFEENGLLDEARSQIDSFIKYEFGKETKVVFRKFKTDGDVVAIFPEIPYDSEGYYCQSYQHVGQHSACSPLIVEDTKLAKPEEYGELKKELEDLGYNLTEIKRIRYSHLLKRFKDANEGVYV